MANSLEIRKQTSMNKLRAAFGLFPEPVAPKAKVKVKKFKKVSHTFVQVTTVDGQILEANDLEEGNQIYLVDDDGNQTAAPAGTYETDECTIEVDSNGEISSVDDGSGDDGDATEGDADASEEMKKVEVKAAKETAPTEAPAEAAAPASDDNLDTQILATLKQLVTEIQAMGAALKATPSADEEMKKVEPSGAGAKQEQKFQAAPVSELAHMMGFPSASPMAMLTAKMGIPTPTSPNYNPNAPGAKKVAQHAFEAAPVTGRSRTKHILNELLTTGSFGQ